MAAVCLSYFLYPFHCSTEVIKYDFFLQLSSSLHPLNFLLCLFCVSSITFSCVMSGLLNEDSLLDLLLLLLLLSEATQHDLTWTYS